MDNYYENLEYPDETTNITCEKFLASLSKTALSILFRWDIICKYPFFHLN